MAMAVVFALVVLLLTVIRNGPFGRRLQAMRDSPAACVTLGLDLTATKLQSFALSAGIAGLGGALLAMWKSSSVGVSDFGLLRGPLPGLALVLVAVVSGITTVFGPIFGGFVFVMMPLIGSWYPALSNMMNLLPGLAGIGLGQNPDGIVGQVAEAIEERGRGARRGRRGAGGADGRARAGGGRRTAHRRGDRGARRRHRPELGPLRAGDGRAVTGEGEGPLLELEEITVRFGGHVAVDSVDLTVAAGRDHGPHRAERRGQDDDLQRDHRAPGALGGAGAAGRHRHHQDARPTGGRRPASAARSNGSRCSAR